jgi:hypothetical protein
MESHNVWMSECPKYLDLAIKILLKFLVEFGDIDRFDSHESSGHLVKFTISQLHDTTKQERRDEVGLTNLVLASVDLGKASFAYLLVYHELADRITTQLRSPGRPGSCSVSHGFLPFAWLLDWKLAEAW